jgi:hypothetical protein
MMTNPVTNPMMKLQYSEANAFVPVIGHSEAQSIQYRAVLRIRIRIRIHRIHMYLGLSVRHAKIVRKTLIPTICDSFDFLSLKTM